MEALGLIALGLLPSIVWLIFFMREHENHPEPFWRIIYVLLLGGVTTFLAFIAQVWIAEGILTPQSISLSSPGVIFVFATIEEIVKWLAVVFFVRTIMRRGRFRDPLRPMIYMITAALGFAAIENIALLISNGGFSDVVARGMAFEILIIRFIGATLLHALASGIVGFHWSVAIVKGRYLAGHIMAGLAIASLLHAVFNYLIIEYGPTVWPIAFVIFISFLVLIDFEEIKEADR